MALQGYNKTINKGRVMKYSGVMLGTDNPKRLGDFYTQVLGKPDFQEGEWYGWKGGGQLMLGPHSEVSGTSRAPQRIMLTFETPDVKAEFDRLKGLGAEVIAEPYQPDETMWLATVADPDGNYLQLSMPWGN